MIERLMNIETWRMLLQDDFCRGYITAVTLMLALLLALLILRVICWFVFRVRRCSEMIVRGPDGELVISRDAAAALVDRELRAYPELKSSKLRIFRKGKEYRMVICCAYDGAAGIPALIEAFKQQLFTAFKDTFGVTSLKRIRIVIEKLNSFAPATPATPAAATPEKPETPPAEQPPVADGN